MTELAVDYSRYFWQGAQVRLRPLRGEDAALYHLASLDSPARQVLQLGIELPASVELWKSKLEPFAGCQEHNGVILFAYDTLDGITVGSISLHSQDRKNGTFSFGIVTYGAHRGHGYAADAARVLLKYGFWEQRYQKCNSGCVHTNAASIRLHARLGFVEEGRRRRQYFFNGQYHDDVLFGLTREEFDTLVAG